MLLRSTVSFAALVLALGVTTGAELKSGPQVGEGISGKFMPNWVNGKYAGKKACPV